MYPFSKNSEEIVNIGKFAKTLKTNVKISVPQSLSLDSTLDFFSITFEVPLTTSSSLERSDFIINGQTTKLGSFRVVSLWLKLNQLFVIDFGHYKYQAYQTWPLLQFSRLDKELDIAEFEYDKTNNTLFYITTLGKLIGDSMSCITGKFGDPIMGDFKCIEFTTKNTLSLILEVLDAFFFLREIY
ncbi:unnamed protein product [Ambrosiozyma monospora]|uniref:Unnamed protein product n=1 Tax=Ambrosiozyma monospora TaxID=43982 RepID=A0ACB5TD20_AMBMO|nr:unnamed protein product [Ambrosiozyma monospora]